jgi:membrane protein DedA with SNARE-associated domain
VIDIARDFFGWVEALPPALAYLMLFVVAYGENIAPPIPGDAIIVFAGYLVSANKMDPILAAALATMAGSLGFMTMFSIGRGIEGSLMHPKRFRWIPKQRLGRALSWVNRKGYLVVLANRFLSGLRSVIALAAGMAGLKAWRTFVFSGISALTWSTLMIGFGYWLGENWGLVSVGLRRYSAVVSVLILLVIVIQVLRYRRDRPAPIEERP